MVCFPLQELLQMKLVGARFRTNHKEMVLCVSGTQQIEIFTKGCHGMTEKSYDLLLFSKHLVSEKVSLSQDIRLDLLSNYHGFGAFVRT